MNKISNEQIAHDLAMKTWIGQVQHELESYPPGENVTPEIGVQIYKSLYKNYLAALLDWDKFEM